MIFSENFIKFWGGHAGKHAKKLLNWHEMSLHISEHITVILLQHNSRENNSTETEVSSFSALELWMEWMEWTQTDGRIAPWSDKALRDAFAYKPVLWVLHTTETRWCWSGISAISEQHLVHDTALLLQSPPTPQTLFQYINNSKHVSHVITRNAISAFILHT